MSGGAGWKKTNEEFKNFCKGADLKEGKRFHSSVFQSAFRK
ncbi:hypothetical protein [Faecalicatena contorta]